MKKNTGYLFWITGLSGSGKTTLSKEILEYVNKEYGNTIVLSGDNLRDACNFKKFDRASRLKYAMSYAKFCKEITDNKINLIFCKKLILLFLLFNHDRDLVKVCFIE